jgi:hypothetical protein
LLSQGDESKEQILTDGFLMKDEWNSPLTAVSRHHSRGNVAPGHHGYADVRSLQFVVYQPHVCFGDPLLLGPTVIGCSTGDTTPPVITLTIRPWVRFSLPGISVYTLSFR